MSEQPGGRGADLTLTCTELVELVTDYLEGSVDDATRVAVEAHLALCPGCAAYIEQMHETLRVVGRVPVESLSDAARDELMNAFRTFHTPAT
ncbi:MAG: hypothetical protein QOI54_1719 [Actinomycetota bacterium]|jgi:predicted anti-sigma-YlaC factor YlaD|nr:hypothetical protein [Actinomycetota bacterium]